MARADYLVALDDPAREDTAIVGANVLDGIVAPLEVEDGDSGAIHVHHTVGVGRKFRGRTDRDPVTHTARNA